MDDIPVPGEGCTLQMGIIGFGGAIPGELFVSRREIGKGSNGTTVYEDKYDDGTPVAVKRLIRGHLTIHLNEIDRLASRPHPNIVRYYGGTFDMDFVLLAQERCTCTLYDLILALSGSSDSSVSPDDPPSSMVKYKNSLESLRATMQDVNLWADGHPSPLLLKLIREVVSGLDHLHNLEIIHLDLKPQNILITGKPLVAKLSDMGISKWLLQDKFSLGYHATSCGTRGWRAPEQLLNDRQTPATDVFCLGCVLFFCLTGGRHPFGEGIERDINIRNNQKDLSSVKSMPEAYDLISRLLDPLPELRPKASEVLHHPFLESRDETVP